MIFLQNYLTLKTSYYILHNIARCLLYTAAERLKKEVKMLALAIFIGVILLCTPSDNKKSQKKESHNKKLQGSSSGYDSNRQVHWTREDTMEIREL